jgi:hypothetical protein
MKFSLLLLLIASAAPGAELPYFHFERAIDDQSVKQGQGCLVLDAGIFEHAAPQLADLRVYRGTVETPYAIHIAEPFMPAEERIMPLNLGSRAGQTVFDATMPPGSYSDLQLFVTGQDFIATINVTGSQSQSAGPQTSLGSFTIFDLTLQKLGRSTVVHMPESDFRYLHFRVTGPVPPEAITGLSAMRHSTAQTRYVTVAENSQLEQKGHTSVVEFTVGPHTPVDRVVFVPLAESGPEPATFSREVTVSVTRVAAAAATDADQPPQPATSSGNILRVHRVEDGHRLDEEHLTIDPLMAAFDKVSKWTITIDNGDDAPLAINSVRLEMLEHDLCFDASADAHYTLLYGDTSLAPPQYDYAQLFVARASAAQLKAGPEEPNPAYKSRPDMRPFTEKHPALLWIALVCVLLLLGGIALRSARHTVRTP